MGERRDCPGYVLAAMAAAGLVLAHWLAYLIASPVPRIRTELLAESGHGYWAVAVRAGMVLGLAGVAAVAIRAMRWDRSSTARSHSLGSMALRLAAIQVPAFVLMEVTERLASSTSILKAVPVGVLAIGLVVQVAVAVAGAALIRWFGRVVERALAAAPARWSPSGEGWAPVQVPVATGLRRVRVHGAAGVRGPPLRSM